MLGDDHDVGAIVPNSTTMLTATMAHAEPSVTATSSSVRTQQSAHPTSASSVAITQPVRRKTVYFTVGQRQEVAIFEDRTPSEEVKSECLFHFFLFLK